MLLNKAIECGIAWLGLQIEKDGDSWSTSGPGRGIAGLPGDLEEARRWLDHSRCAHPDLASLINDLQFA